MEAWDDRARSGEDDPTSDAAGIGPDRRRHASAVARRGGDTGVSSHRTVYDAADPTHVV